MMSISDELRSERIGTLMKTAKLFSEHLSIIVCWIENVPMKMTKTILIMGGMFTIQHSGNKIVLWMLSASQEKILRRRGEMIYSFWKSFFM